MSLTDVPDANNGVVLSLLWWESQEDYGRVRELSEKRNKKMSQRKEVCDRWTGNGITVHTISAAAQEISYTITAGWNKGPPLPINQPLPPE